MTTLTNPTLLSFEGKLVCSDGLMMAGNWKDKIDKLVEPNRWKPIKIQSKSVRGTISNRDERSDEEHNDHAKFIKDIANPNIQTVDNAALRHGDTLKVSFTLRILGNLAQPYACNEPDYKKELTSKITEYIKDEKLKGLDKLAMRYAINIANGRFLWRNRVCAESVIIIVKFSGEQLDFDAYKIDMDNFDWPEDKVVQAKLKELANVIKEGLADTTGELFSFIEVEAFTKLGNGQTVYPSQEMLMEKSDKGGKSKTLYQLNEGDPDKSIAAMHSQKIGNALRTIDDWHSEADEAGAIAVEPYGSVTNRGEAYRPKSKGAFYTLLDNWILKGKTPAEDEQHYIMAVFIRGGVFSAQKDEKEKKAKK